MHVRMVDVPNHGRERGGSSGPGNQHPWRAHGAPEGGGYFIKVS